MCRVTVVLVTLVLIQNYVFEYKTEKAFQDL